MSNRTTVLRTQRHGEFLGAQHQDPITRKVFTAGDRVVQCAACLLPFLEESWGGMGGAHCGQTGTTGIEAFETAATTPVDESSNNPSHSDALRLRPIHCKLREVPIKLH